MDCRHHPTCPGCPLMGQPYDDQLRAKHARLAAALEDYAHLGLPELPPVRPAAHTEAYRHRLKLPINVGRKHVRIGLYDPEKPGRVLDTPDCPVLADGLRAALPPLLAWLRGHPEVHSVDLRVSDATGDLQLVLACSKGRLSGGKGAAHKLQQAVPRLISIAVSTADPQRKRVMGARPHPLLGPRHLVERIGDTEVRLHPGAFFQVDPRTAADLHDRVAAAVGEARTVLDLYAGVGAYALRLAPGRGRVLAVEEVPSAVAAAREVAPPNVEVVRSRVEDLPLRERFDVAILNPARRGSDPQVLARLTQIAKRLVYVSCGPETLARDLDCLAAHGMHPTAIEPLDLFPQTREVETVVHLAAGPPRATWPVQGGRAGGPWLGHPSGAVGRAKRALVLVIGDPGSNGSVPGARWTRLGRVAGHGLLRLQLDGPLPRALGGLARRGHAVAGRHPPTQRFFAAKAGLVRPFVHVEVAGRASAPLHGDLRAALRALGASKKLLARAGAAPHRAPRSR